MDERRFGGRFLEALGGVRVVSEFWEGLPGRGVGWDCGLFGFVVWFVVETLVDALRQCDGWVKTLEEKPESLILAQNERWRQA